MPSSTSSLPFVSIIIPTRNSASTIEQCLTSVLGQQHIKMEIIVVDNQSTDETSRLASAMGCRSISGGPERSAQRNLGAREAHGEWFLFLDSDMVLEPESIASAVMAAERMGAAASILPELASGEGFWSACRTLEKQCYLGNINIEAARLFRREAFFDARGYDENIHGGGEDWDLPERVRARGLQIARGTVPVVHLEGRLRLRDTASKKFYYGRTLGRYVRKQPTFAARKLLGRFIGRNWRLLAKHPVRAAGLFVLKLVEFSAALAGVVVAGFGKTHPAERGETDVLIISSGFRPNLGGLETHLDDLVEYLSAAGYRIDVATLQPFTTKAKASSLEQNGLVRVRRHRWIGRGWFFTLARYPPLAFLYLIAPLTRAAIAGRGRRPKVVYAQGLVAGAAAALVFPSTRKVLATHSLYSLSSPFARMVAGRILRAHDFVLCVSERSRDEAVGLGTSKERVGTFTYWIDLQRFRPRARNDLRKEHHLDGQFIVLFVGRLIKEKGVEIALKAAEALTARSNGWLFLFAGAGPEAKRVLAMQQSIPSVQLLGPQDPDELSELYAASDVVLVPSPSEEGFGRVILESLACGTPVIATNRGSVPEVVGPEVGCLIEPVPGAVIEALTLLRNDPEKLGRLRENARRYAESRFSHINARVIEHVLFGKAQ